MAPPSSSEQHPGARPAPAAGGIVGGGTVGDGVPPAVRAQILATEHWSLLATRSTTWSEVMSRITIYLTVASAALVVLALVGQASSFGTPFQILSVGLTSAVLVLGTLTAWRVKNASQEDAGMILGMNRLRAAYLAIDPSLGPHLMTSPHDDVAGLMVTYTLGQPRRMVSHVVASTTFFVVAVNTMVAGTLGALIAHASDAGTGALALVGAAVGSAYLGVMLEVGRRTFERGPSDVRFPSPDPGADQDRP